MPWCGIPTATITPSFCGGLAILSCAALARAFIIFEAALIVGVILFSKVQNGLGEVVRETGRYACSKRGRNGIMTKQGSLDSDQPLRVLSFTEPPLAKRRGNPCRICCARANASLGSNTLGTT